MLCMLRYGCARTMAAGGHSAAVEREVEEKEVVVAVKVVGAVAETEACRHAPAQPSTGL